jgi:hypothetical protein
MLAFKGNETLEGENAKIDARIKRIIEHDFSMSNNLKSEAGQKGAKEKNKMRKKKICFVIRKKGKKWPNQNKENLEKKI